MRFHPIIRQFSVGFLLLLLVLGSTPRQWLHDWFATHTGCNLVRKSDAGHASLQPDRLHCRNADQVVDMPFVDPGGWLIAETPRVYVHLICHIYSFAPSRYTSSATLRGPPCQA